MLRISLAIAALLSASCVMSGDLKRLQDAQVTFEDRVVEAIADQEATSSEKLDEIAEANRDRIAEAEEVIKDVVTRSIDAGKNLAELDWVELLISLLGTAGVAAVGGTALTNKVRDNRRRMRGEPVTPTK